MVDAAGDNNPADPAEADYTTVWFTDHAGAPQARAWKCLNCNEIRLSHRSPFCPNCLSQDATAMVLSRRATIYSKTVIHRGFPGVPVPYTVALVDLAEGIRLRTSVVGEGANQVAIGDEVTLVPTPEARELAQAGLVVRPGSLEMESVGMVLAEAVER